MLTELSAFLSLLRDSAPLVHCITNRVTMNDCANILLAAGARPIMADDPDECAEITAISRGLCLNIGTLDKTKISGMLASGRAANELGLPVLLDPVGVGASRLRTETALKIISELSLAAIRMNRSELISLTASLDEADMTADNITARENPERERAARCGVDSIGDTDDIDNIANLSLRLSQKTGAVVIVTGAVDVIADAMCARALLIRNGDSRMRKVTGCGCMLSSLCTAYFAAAYFAAKSYKNESAKFLANESAKSHANDSSYLAASPEEKSTARLYAAAAAVTAMGVSGELAASRMGELDGNASLRAYLIDAIYNLTSEQLEQLARVGEYIPGDIAVTQNNEVV